MLKRATRSGFGRGVAGVVLVGAAVTVGGLGGCGDAPKAKTVTPVLRDVPEPLRGTVGAVATIRGVEPQLISGLGLVVGLNGTGGGELSPSIQAAMEREVARGGIGKGGVLTGGDLQGVTPRQLLRDPNVAVVIVEAAISPGWPQNHKFDVYVRTLPSSTVTSLEGGTLWTTELRLGPASTIGSVRSRILGEARGQVFINPFADPGAEGETVTRTRGRILGGGTMTEPLQLELVLDNPSHALARSIVGAINARFPEGPGDDGPTARGRNSDSIAVRVPRAYADRPEEFVEMLRCTRLRQEFPQEYARRYVDDLKAYPSLADDLSWCLQAIGKVAVPFLPPMYEYGELSPRMAALRAGAKLGDGRVAPHLIELAKTGPASVKIEAVELLGRLPANPRINMALWEMVDSPELDVRVAAYEALAERNDWGIARTAVDDHFDIDLVPAREGLIYVTQQGRPRIVVFGGGEGNVIDPARPTPKGPQIVKPALVAAWGDRLILTAEGPTDAVRIRYTDFRTGRVVTMGAPEDVAKLIEFLGHKPTPEEPRPGLGLTYSEVVGALYEIQRQGAIAGAFATERDRLAASVLRASKSTTVMDRPEVSGQDVPQPVVIFSPEEPKSEAGKAADPKKKSLVVPLNQGTPKDGKKGGPAAQK